MHLNQDLNIGSNGVTHSLNQFYDLVFLFQGQFVICKSCGRFLYLPE